MSKQDWILTYSGRVVHPLSPSPDEIHITDIAHALSQVCRYTGHTRSFLSVAQHSVIVSAVVPEEDALWGLLHDASEAYLSDLARPIKKQPAMEIYRESETALMNAIMDHFGLPHEMPASVKEADDRILLNEKAALMPPGGPTWAIETIGLTPLPEIKIESWSPSEAKSKFLERFVALTAA